MKGNQIREEILRRLKQSEKENEIQILYACESGSRAWGFESSDSDYDVIAPSKARRILRGESPRRARASHPPVSSLGSMAERNATVNKMD